MSSRLMAALGKLQKFQFPTATDGNGSVFAVKRKPAAAHDDAAVHEAEIGQLPTFSAREKLLLNVRS